MRRFFPATFFAINLVVLAACGQKGPLYLPNAPQAEPPSSAQSSSVEERADAIGDSDEPDQ